MSPDRPERRRHPRTSLVGVVDYTGAEGVSCTGIKNIGLGGVRLDLTGRERPGARVQLSIVLAGNEEPIQVVGQVVWARQSEPYEVGIRFVEVDTSRLEAVLP